MRRAHLVALPVHRQSVRSQYLHPVHADIANAPCRVGRDHHRKGDVPSAVTRPGGEERNAAQIDVLISLDHLLTGRTTALLPGRELADLRQPGQHRQLAEQSLGHLEIQHFRNALADLVEVGDPERQVHPADRAEQVDGDRLRAAPAVVEQDMLEEESLASPGLFITRSAISAISRRARTGWLIRASSPIRRWP